MQLKYIATKEDFINFNKIFMNEKNKKIDIFFKILSFVMMLVSFYFIYYTFSIYQEFHLYFVRKGFGEFFKSQMDHFLWIVLSIVIAVFLFFEVKIIINRTIKKMINNPDNAYFFTEKTIDFSNEKIWVQQTSSESTFQWESIAKIVETKQYLFLFNSSATGILIPKKVIPQEMYDMLYELFMAKIQNKVLIDK